MNSTWSSYDIVLPSELSVMYMIMFILIIILTLITFKRMKTLQLQHYLMICLAVVDLSTVPPHLFGFIGYVKGFLPIDETLCKAISISNHGVVAVTTWLHCGICIDKYLSILKPMAHRELVLKYKPSLLAVLFSLSVFALILAIMLASVLSGLIEAVYDPSFVSCMFKVDISYVGLIRGLYIVIPLLVGLTTHLMILMKLRKSEFRRRKMIKKSMRTVVLVVGTYYVCWVPFLVDIIWKLSVGPYSQPPAIFSWLTANFVIANSFMNSFIHFLCNKEFKNKCRSLLSVSCIKFQVEPQ